MGTRLWVVIGWRRTGRGRDLRTLVFTIDEWLIYFYVAAFILPMNVKDDCEINK
jgi:hypothetical protein